ncbi:MAG: potassium transporter TrkH [Deltaproteobacteria bacterium]|jgi:trk system potassium uptake protein TrkH|nr:potassium transporter TrkH [Deltaproteobacteria bacterium]
MRAQNRFVLPFVLPVASFAAAIFIGSLLLWSPLAQAGKPVAYIDALFIATSSVCVTGLSTVDIYTTFSTFGHVVMLFLIQLGGISITACTTLILYLVSHRISLTDRLAVGNALLNDPSFNLGKFLKRVLIYILTLELCAAAILCLFEPERISAFSAIFLTVSAFCNAGFALWSDNLMSWQQNALVTTVVMTMIVLGGIGFAVLDESLYQITTRLRRQRAAPWSLQTKLVWRTTIFLIVAGAALLMLFEYFANDSDPSTLPELVLPSFFQSVTARTAGFNTVTIGSLTDISLLVLILLMLIGGSPGSCAGGIKTTSFRVLLSFISAQLRGRSQVVVDGKAVDTATLNKTFLLLIFTFLAIGLATFALALTEGGANPHGKTPFQVLDLLFEAVSAFATVGLTTTVSPNLSDAGKLIDCALMYMGRLGPIWLITTIQQLQTEPRYRLPERSLSIG